MFIRIRNMREDKDLTQKQVAEYLKMSQTGYSKYETGENNIPAQILIMLSELYQTSIDYLVEKTDERLPYPKHRKNN
ncbi:MAG: helix-turn-helix transcriptional regulator [Oscillospiraceae bacterium]